MASQSEIYEIDVKGKLSLNLHPGQSRAWDSGKRFVFIIAGTQSGKTSFGPWWLWREIDRCGPGDYLVVTANYDLFKLKLLPEMLKVFGIVQPEWEYKKIDKTLTSPDGNTRVILRSADAEAGLESATAKAAWLDECGQDKFRLSAWEAVQRRLSLEQGRVLATTTPYNMGWLKSQVFERWTGGDQDYQVIQFKSIENPAFPREEYERAKATLPDWKFKMFYQGRFEQPAGLIYDSFDKAFCVVDPFDVPDWWHRFGGLDFGGVNTAAVCYAQDGDTGALYLIKEYHEGKMTAAEHAAALKSWNCRLWVGGSKSEDQWRREFRKAGLPIVEPTITEVEVGIDRVYGEHKRNNIFVFNTCERYLDEKSTYGRELNADGQPTEKIKDKNEYHLMDAERYIIGKIVGRPIAVSEEQPEQRSKWSEHDIDTGSRWRKY